MKQIAVREAREEDAVAFAEIYRPSVETGTASFEEVAPSPAEILERMREVRARGLPWLAAEIDGRVVGYAYASPFRARAAYRYSLENSVYVAEAAQRRGVARALMADLIARCAALGYRQMIAAVSGGEASVALHERLGFRRIGAYERVGVKFGRELDVVLLQRGLGEHV